MLHAFRIGPIANAPKPCFLYAARAPSGDVHATQAFDDDEGLRLLLDELDGQPILVEPLLAKAGKRLGLRRAPLPPELACEKATMALALALRMHELIGDRVPPSLVADLLDAAMAFQRAAPWRFVDSDLPLTVEVNDGKRQRTIDGALMGSGGEEFGFALYPQPGALRRLLAADDPERVAARTDLVAVSIEREPAWVAAAVKQGLGAPVVPMPMHMKNGRPRALDPGELAMLTALLRAASEIGPNTREVRGTSGVEPRADVVVHVPVEAAAGPVIRNPPVVLESPRPRPKVGRNAPCPCGSGLKYKRCCLTKDEAAARAQTPKAAPRTHEKLEPEVRLVLEIIAFADEHVPSWRSSPSAGWRELMAEPAAAQLLMPLLAYQYHLVAGLTAASMWRTNVGNLDAQTREIFESEQRALLSVWEVLEVQPEVGLQLVNLLTHEQCFVHEMLGTRGITVRDAVLARVCTRRGRSVFSGLHPRPLPPAAAHEVVTVVRRGLGLEVAAVPPLRLDHAPTIDALLSEWHAADARRVDRALVERELQTTDGEPFEPHEDHFGLTRGTTLEDVAAALLALPGTHLDEDGPLEKCLTFTKPGNAMHSHWTRTVIGTATLDGRSLVLEANSRGRIDELRGRLERALGPCVEHRRRKRHPVKTTRMPSDAEGPLAVDATMIPGIWAPPPELMLREEARHFMERPHDALDGLSPRVAVTKTRPRRALHQLLKEHEHAQARSGTSGFATYVRNALDLSPTGERVPIDAHTRRTGRGRKVSDTLIDFAVPILGELTHESQLRPVLELATLAWNLEVLELGEQAADVVALATEAGLEEAAQWLQRLRERRRLFAEDERIIEVLELRWEDGQISIKAAARLALRPHGHSRAQLGLFE